MSILKDISQLAEGKVKELKVVAGLETEMNVLKIKIRKGFAEIGQYIINNIELWHDSHPQVAIDFIKLRELVELKRVYNIIKGQMSNEYLSELQNKNKKDNPLNNILEKFFDEKNQEIDIKLTNLEKDKELLAENIGKFYLTQRLYSHVPYLTEKYRQVGIQIQELQIIHTQIDSFKKGKEQNHEQSVKQIIDEVWPTQNEKNNVEGSKKEAEKRGREGLSLVERVRLLEDSYIYSKPPLAKGRSPVPENINSLWEWNDSLPWQKPLSVLGRNEVIRIENQRYLGWVAKDRKRRAERPVDCRKCQFRKPFENKPEFYCSIISNCNDQNAEGFRHGELAKTCNYYKPKRKRYKLHKII